MQFYVVSCADSPCVSENCERSQYIQRGATKRRIDDENKVGLAKGDASAQRILEILMYLPNSTGGHAAHTDSCWTRAGLLHCDCVTRHTHSASQPQHVRDFMERTANMTSNAALQTKLDELVDLAVEGNKEAFGENRAGFNLRLAAG